MAHDEEAARYHRAAELALDQLEWCIDYLRSIHKNRLAKQLARNHAEISRRFHGATGPAPRHRLREL